MSLRRMRCDSFVVLGFYVIISTFIATLFLYEHLMHNCHLSSRSAAVGGPDVAESHHPSETKGSYDAKTTPLIFIGGYPRSGTTLMRVMLDAHPDVRCGEETHIISPILSYMMMMIRNVKSTFQRFLEAGVTDEVLFAATGSFILEIIVRHAEPAPRLCNKDPFTLSYTVELNRMFPLAQFILMIRDGRAVCHSVAFRDLGIGGADYKNMTNCLISWNREMTKMYNDCVAFGVLKCLPVRYEQLVLHPRSVLMKVLEFLEVPWNEVVLHHETEINKPGGISLSRLEPSTDQVVKPVNIDSLTKWANFILDDVRQEMRQIAPMLEVLGYDPDAYPPNYGRPDKEVEENTLLVQKNQVFFQQLGWEARNRTKILDQ